MPSAVPIFLKKSDEKQVIYFTWPNRHFLEKNWTLPYMVII